MGRFCEGILCQGWLLVLLGYCEETRTPSCGDFHALNLYRGIVCSFLYFKSRCPCKYNSVGSLVFRTKRRFHKNMY